MSTDWRLHTDCRTHPCSPECPHSQITHGPFRDTESDELVAAIRDLYQSNERGIELLKDTHPEAAELLRSANRHLLAEVELPPETAT